MKSTLTLLLLLTSLFSFSQITIPNGFSEVTKSPSNGKKMEKIFMLFDNDSINDTAILAQDKSEFSSYKLLIFLSNKNKTYEINLISLNDFSIYPVQIKARKNVIEFGYFEDGTAAFGRFIKLRYNSKKEQIQVIGYDVEYKSSPTEYINKSYNLITGDYIVKRTYYEGSKKINTQEFSGKNDFFKNVVFIENLDKEMIINLDDVGCKYE
jgi:hypothetical protein